MRVVARVARRQSSATVPQAIKEGTDRVRRMSQYDPTARDVLESKRSTCFFVLEVERYYFSHWNIYVQVDAERAEHVHTKYES